MRYSRSRSVSSVIGPALLWPRTMRRLLRGGFGVGIAGNAGPEYILLTSLPRPISAAHVSRLYHARAALDRSFVANLDANVNRDLHCRSAHNHCPWPRPFFYSLK